MFFKIFESVNFELRSFVFLIQIKNLLRKVCNMIQNDTWSIFGILDKLSARNFYQPKIVIFFLVFFYLLLFMFFRIIYDSRKMFGEGQKTSLNNEKWTKITWTCSIYLYFCFWNISWFSKHFHLSGPKTALGSSFFFCNCSINFSFFSLYALIVSYYAEPFYDINICTKFAFFVTHILTFHHVFSMLPIWIICMGGLFFFFRFFSKTLEQMSRTKSKVFENVLEPKKMSGISVRFLKSNVLLVIFGKSWPVVHIIYSVNKPRILAKFVDIQNVGKNEKEHKKPLKKTHFITFSSFSIFFSFSQN